MLHFLENFDLMVVFFYRFDTIYPQFLYIKVFNNFNDLIHNNQFYYIDSRANIIIKFIR